jgi:hypothetical protein
MFASRAALAAVLILLGVNSTTARAQGIAEAHARAEAGARAYAAGDYLGAIDAFRDAYAVNRDATLLFDIGQSYYRAGQRQEALDYYRMYLERAASPPNRKEVEARIAELEHPVKQPARPPAPRVTLVEHPLTSPEQLASAAPDDDIDALIDRDRRHGTIGGTLRADIDAVTGGAAFLLGASLPLVPAVELGVAFLVGASPGLEGEVTFVLGRHLLRPLLAVSVPVFFENGLRPGGGLSAGVRLMLGNHFGLRGEIGVVHFFSVPPTYRRDVLVGSIGIEGWL